ncbi:MAG: potassium transporter [Bacteroidetes bacterium]|nr:MAG: potassium transporter [Bacteroidota bacterium]
MDQRIDPGLGIKFQKPVNRLLNSDGSYNIRRIGGLNRIQDVYKHLIDMSWGYFFLYSGLFYLIVNLFFSVLYLIAGVDQLKGATMEEQDFMTAFFFSVQTFTTVGYGAIYPHGLFSQLVATVEAFCGLLSFALATGLLYGRFSKPVVRIAFSKNVILTPYQGGEAVMFKMVNQRKNVLLKTRVNAILILDKGGADNSFNKEYYEVKLENNEVYFFPLTWTLVHPIDEDSPFWDMGVGELKYRNAELVLLVEAFDETYGQTVLQKYSYAGDQWKDGVRFDRNFGINDEGQIELHVDRIDDLLPLD